MNEDLGYRATDCLKHSFGRSTHAVLWANPLCPAPFSRVGGWECLGWLAGWHLLDWQTLMQSGTWWSPILLL